MNGFDRLLAKSLDTVIRDNLGENTIKKIEKRLFEKYGISLVQSIEEFQKIDTVLKEFFGSGADGIEAKFLQNICKVRSKNNINNKLVIKDDNLSQMILESFGDDDNTVIINSVINEPKIISDVLMESKIPQTSGYRKMNQLIEKGLIIPDGYIVREGRKILTYRALFENIHINIVKNKITVDVELNKSNFDSSSVLQVIHS